MRSDVSCWYCCVRKKPAVVLGVMCAPAPVALRTQSCTRKEPLHTSVCVLVGGVHPQVKPSHVHCTTILLGSVRSVELFRDTTEKAGKRANPPRGQSAQGLEASTLIRMAQQQHHDHLSLHSWNWVLPSWVHVLVHFLFATYSERD